MRNILEVNALEKSFKNVKAVNGVSFALEPGDIFAFLGPNGAGKTTTLRILLDIIKADNGSISWGFNGNTSACPTLPILAICQRKGAFIWIFRF